MHLVGLTESLRYQSCLVNVIRRNNGLALAGRGGAEWSSDQRDNIKRCVYTNHFSCYGSYGGFLALNKTFRLCPNRNYDGFREMPVRRWAL